MALAGSIWGAACVVGKAVLNVVEPLPLLAVRFAIALLILASAAHFKGKLKINRKDLPLLIIVGLVGFPVSMAAQFVGTDLTNASLASLITATSPALIGIFAMYLLKEPMVPRQWLALGITLAGMFTMGGTPDLNTSSMWGLILLGISALSWALYTVLGKMAASKYSALTVQVYAMGFGLLGTLPMAIPAWKPIPHLSLGVILGILFLSIISTALGFYLWNQGLTMIDSATGSLFLFFQPIVGVFLAAITLGEHLSLWQWIGSIVALGGVLMALMAEQPESSVVS